MSMKVNRRSVNALCYSCSAPCQMAVEFAETISWRDDEPVYKAFAICPDCAKKLAGMLA